MNCLDWRHDAFPPCAQRQCDWQQNSLPQEHHQLSGADLQFMLIGLICKQCKQPGCMLPQFTCHHAVEACIDQHVSAANAAQNHISIPQCTH